LTGSAALRDGFRVFAEDCTLWQSERAARRRTRSRPAREMQWKRAEPKRRNPIADRRKRCTHMARMADAPAFVLRPRVRV
jgi:hypothetical protein